MHKLPRNRCVSLLNLRPTTTNHLNQIFAQLITNNLTTPTLLAKLIDQYCSTPNTHQAFLIFTHYYKPNLFLFNTLLRCTKPKDSIFIFASKVSSHDIVFDHYTYIFVLGSCARLPSLSTLWFGRQLQARIFKHGFLFNLMLETTLIHFYGSNYDVGSARKVFDEMPIRSVATWNAMIRGYCLQGERVNECAYDGLLLFKDILVDVCGEKPNDITMVCVLSSVSLLGVLEFGACLHGYVEKTICMPENDVFIGTGLIDMYSRCGCIDSALKIFNQMIVKNVLTWSAMATGLAFHGRGQESLELLNIMVASGVQPNAVTFTSLFSASCHAGLVEEGLYLFNNMERKFGIEPRIQHYGCIVDLLGRAGHLKEAYEFIQAMQVKPDAILWRSLLNACNVHSDVELGEKVAKILLQLQPKRGWMDSHDASQDYVALSNVYAAAERWGHVEMVRKKMKIKKIEVKPGSTLVSTLKPLSNNGTDGFYI